MARTLRGYAEGRDDAWEAICLDLDIAVQGASFTEVLDSLNEAISLYLDSVSELPEDERASLLDRPAPWSVRTRFLRYAVRSFFAVGDDGPYRHQFTLPGAAYPHT